MLLADHGEMLGERGLWYKMNFHEGASRVPLIVHAPGRFAARRVKAAVSLLDVLPTLVGIAGGGGSPNMRLRLMVAASLPHCEGAPDDAGEVIGEYLAEGVDRADGDDPPRRAGSSSTRPTDPDQLYDLVADPDERHNLAPRRSARCRFS